MTFTIDPVADTPSVTNASTTVNTQTTTGLIITINPVDSIEVTHFQITGIANGTLFQNNGTTPINNGDFITVAEGNAGLKFTPATNTANPGTTYGFDVQASVSSVIGGLGGGLAHATVFVTDPVPPDTIIDTAPPAFDSNNSPTFTFHGTDNISPAVLTFKFSMDGSAFAPAVSPLQLNGLSEGSHTFQVRTIDAGGTTDPTPASYTWIVDTIAPVVTIGAPSATHANNTATVIYTVTYTDANIASVTLNNLDILVNGNGARDRERCDHQCDDLRGTSHEHHGRRHDRHLRGGGHGDRPGRQLGRRGRAGAVFIADNTKPVVTIGPPSVATTVAGPVTWVVTVADANLSPTYMLSTSDVQVIGTPASITGTVSITRVTATLNQFNVKLSNIVGGKGKVQIQIAAGAAVDLAQNASDASAISTQALVTGLRKLVVSQVVPPVRLAPGSSHVYTVIGRNAGTQISLGAAIFVKLPAFATFVASSSTAGWVNLGGGRFRFDLGDLAPKTGKTLKFAVVFSSAAPNGTKVGFTASMTDTLALGKTLSSSTTYITLGLLRSRWR